MALPLIDMNEMVTIEIVTIEIVTIGIVTIGIYGCVI